MSERPALRGAVLQAREQVWPLLATATSKLQ